jgi:hypothetical protein
MPVALISTKTSPAFAAVQFNVHNNKWFSSLYGDSGTYSHFFF